MEIRTLADIFFTSVNHDVERHVIFKRGTEWQVISSRQLYGYVAALARVLKVIDPELKNPATAEWEYAFRIFHLLL